jgi:DNA-binding transcriptional ArsR family regulator
MGGEPVEQVLDPCVDLVDRLTPDFLKALASDTRQQILMLFVGGQELTVGEIATACGLGQSTTSEQTRHPAPRRSAHLRP